MRSWIVAIVCLCLSNALLAQEQLALRVNEQGLLKVLEMAVRYNTASKASRTFVVPANIYKFTLPKKQFASNPIVQVVNEISDLNLNRDLDFYLHTDNIKISGDVDHKSLKAEIFNSTSQGFDLRLSISLPRVEVTGPSLSLCEDKRRNYKQCGDGLKAKITNLKVVTKNRPVVLTAVLRLRTDGNVARLRVISVKSNLESKSAPTLSISFNSIVVPPVSIIINGQETKLDTSRLKDEIMKRRSFLAAKLLNFAGDFVANDLAEMINVYLINKSIATTWQLYRKDTQVSFNEFLQLEPTIIARDNTYVRPRIIYPLRPQQMDPIKGMMSQIADVIQNAQLNLSLRKLSTPNNKDIELAGQVDFVLNRRTMRVNNTLGNSNRVLPKLNLSNRRKNDINLAISEPLINGALDLVSTTGLYQEIFDTYAKVQGFSVKSLKIHFTSNETLVAVVNASIDLKKLKSSGVKDWFKNKIAAWLERNNNNSVIYFPIQIEVSPQIRSLKSGGVGLFLHVKSPFRGNGLINTFKYPSNVPNMTDTVRDGVMDELRESLQEYVDKSYTVDLNKFLNQAGVEFRPNMVQVNQAAYLLLDLDIVDIKFDSKNPNRR